VTGFLNSPVASVPIGITTESYVFGSPDHWSEECIFTLGDIELYFAMSDIPSSNAYSRAAGARKGLGNPPEWKIQAEAYGEDPDNVSYGEIHWQEGFEFNLIGCAQGMLEQPTFVDVTTGGCDENFLEFRDATPGELAVTTQGYFMLRSLHLFIRGVLDIGSNSVFVQ